ncbi:sorting nexin-15 isoform X2 [Mustelus asterias]
MSGRGGKAEELERRYRVSEPRQHPQGFTEYRVTATIVSKKKVDIKEITVFKRYSDFKKLHGELSYIHRNLFRKSEEFPAFPRAQVFGRFDDAVIEERRHCAEEMLQFTVNIPALYNSPQLKDFFKDAEIYQPLELAASHEAPSLPAPLIPLPSGESQPPPSWPSHSPAGPESGGLTQPLTRRELDGGGEADHPAWHGPAPHGPAPHGPAPHGPAPHGPAPHGPAPHGPAPHGPAPHSPVPLNPAQATHRIVEEADPAQRRERETNSPFDSGTEEEQEELRLRTGSPLSHTELALFDPCAKGDVDSLPDASQQSSLVELADSPSSLHTPRPTDELEKRLLHLRVPPDEDSPPPPVPEELDCAEYLSTAAECIKEALERESTQEYEVAFRCYQNGVDILLKGLQGDLSAERREAVKKKTAEYLKHAETIFTLHLNGSSANDTPSSS